MHQIGSLDVVGTMLTTQARLVLTEKDCAGCCLTTFKDSGPGAAGGRAFA
jgi:hypothetical protein